MDIQVPDRTIGQDLKKTVVFVGGTLLLVATWSFLFACIAAMTEAWLVPWDLTPFRPPLGTWERTVNDFFEAWPGSILPSVVFIVVSASIYVARTSARTADRALLPLAFAAANMIFFWGAGNDFWQVPPGALLPSVVFVVVNASIFVARTVRTTDRALLPLAFAATNMIFFLVGAFLATLAHRLPDLWLPEPRPPIDLGYHRTWPAILVTTVLLIVLFVAQSKLAIRRNGS